jgi:hypothetical protein
LGEKSAFSPNNQGLALYRRRRANTILAMTGSCFWQEESYDHLVRNEREFEKIRSYIEEHPVRAGLVRESGDQGVRPTSARRL